MLKHLREIGSRVFGWIIPAALAVLAVLAVNKAQNQKAKVKRLEKDRSQATQDYIDDRGGDVTAAHERLQAAQKKTREANAKAKERLDKLASTSDTMAESLDKYRRDHGLHRGAGST